MQTHLYYTHTHFYYTHKDTFVLYTYRPIFIIHMHTHFYYTHTQTRTGTHRHVCITSADIFYYTLTDDTHSEAFLLQTNADRHTYKDAHIIIAHSQSTHCVYNCLFVFSEAKMILVQLYDRTK